MASPCPVALAPPISLSAKAPHPINGESPTLPGFLNGIPPVEVAAAMFPSESSATAPTVLNTLFPLFFLLQVSSLLLVMSSLGSISWNPNSIAIFSAPSATYILLCVLSIIALANEIGFFILLTAATEPKFRELPSTIIASNSTNPSSFNAEPIPALKLGSSSITFTALSTASRALPPESKTPRASLAALSTPFIRSSNRSFGVSHAPPCTITTRSNSLMLDQ